MLEAFYHGISGAHSKLAGTRVESEPEDLEFRRLSRATIISSILRSGNWHGGWSSEGEEELVHTSTMVFRGPDGRACMKTSAQRSELRSINTATIFQNDYPDVLAK
ncbi:hypothetical protein GB937_005349 [Aspergillus fischeri]|nr:hypothetical protein GB937_005349 [Aspergillus fischeri]